MTESLLLSNLRVVEIGQVLSAPYAGMVFSDLGAEVIKIEKPGAGDDARQMGPAYRDDTSMIFHSINRGKHSVVLDLKTQAGRAALFKLLEASDVLLHNLRPGEADRLGIGADVVRQLCPHLVYCEMSAFGHKGPRRLQPGYEPLLQAFSGLMSTNGEPDRPPVRIAASLVDEGTALWTVIGALAALHARRSDGKGRVVHTSLLETALAWSSHRILAEVNEGRPSERLGTAHPNLAPYQAFPASDGLLMVAAGNNQLFAKLANCLGRPQWCGDPRFAGNRERLLNRDALAAEISDVMQTATRASWEGRLTAAGVPVAPINTIAEAVAEPQVAALGMIQTVPGSDGVLTGLPVSFDHARPPVSGWGPALGSHTRQYVQGPGSTTPLD